MGGGRRGIMTTSLRKADHTKNAFIHIIRPLLTSEPVRVLTPEQIETLKSLPKEHLADIVLNENKSDLQPSIPPGFVVKGIVSAYLHTAPIGGN